MSTETTEQPVVDPRRAQVLVPHDPDEEFVAFVRSAGPYLHRTAYLLSGDGHRAEELVQATFERTYRAWDRARGAEPRAYARRILLNLRIDGWRRDRHAGTEHHSEGGYVPDHADDVVVRDELAQALRALPPGQRRVVVLRHLLDLSEAQVADELGISLGAVKSANARGLARLRSLLVASARDAVPAYRLDDAQVLRRVRSAARRRRTAQGTAVAVGVISLVVGLLLAGPVHVPGLGPVTLPGSTWLRDVLHLHTNGLAGLPTDHADATTCTRPDGDAPTTSVGAPVDDRGGLTVVGTLELADAHQVEPCGDVVVDHRWSTGAVVDVDATTLGDGESVLRWSDPYLGRDIERVPGPATLEAQAPDGRGGYVSAPVAQSARVDGRYPHPFGLVRLGRRATWFETPNTQVVGTLPWALRLLDEDGRVVTVDGATEDAEARTAALSDEAVWWTTTRHVAARGCSGRLQGALVADPASPLRDVRRQVCAIGSSPDGVVVARAEGSLGSGRDVVFELLSRPAGDAATTLLTVESAALGDGPVTAVAHDDGTLAFAAGDSLYVVDVAGRRGREVRGTGVVDAIDVSAGSVAWSSLAGSGYVLVSRGASAGLVELPGERVAVGLHDGRVAWSVLDGSAGHVTFGRLRG